MKTHNLVTVEQGWPQSGIGSEICARVIESRCIFYYLISINIIESVIVVFFCFLLLNYLSVLRTIVVCLIM